MKHISSIITVLTVFFTASCVKNDYVKEANYDFKTNYEVFWNLVNENYCFLGDNYGYRKNVYDENGVAQKLDWNKVYEEMMPQVEAATTEEELMDIMGKSIDYLQDGHVWIDSKFTHRGCFTFYNIAFPAEETYPKNFISGLITGQNSKILDYVYRSRNGHRYGVITRGDKKFFYLHKLAYFISHIRHLFFCKLAISKERNLFVLIFCNIIIYLCNFRSIVGIVLKIPILFLYKVVNSILIYAKNLFAFFIKYFFA